MQILLTGGSGLLGTELKRLDADLVTPTRRELDVTDPEAVARYVGALKPDTICHAAAVTDNRQIEASPSEALAVNVVGSVNLARACAGTRIRFVYLSTDYVYKGDRGDYREADAVHPVNLYAWTKLAGEVAARAVDNHLIIRTSFGRSEFDYPAAFSDKWSSKEYVDTIAADILAAVKSPLTGIINIGGPKRTLYEYAKERNTEVKSINRRHSPHASPADTSLDQTRWSEYKAGGGVVRAVENCRICRSEDLIKYLDLGMMPLANNLAETAMDARSMQRFPMQVLYCRECALSQLSVVIDPRLLFSHYTYRSSVNRGYVKHCREMAKSTGEELGLTSADLVVDVAGNDGTLLKQFRELLDVDVLNIDPAENISALAEAAGIQTLNDFWSINVAQTVLEKYKAPKLITATNVFAHVDDVGVFFEAAKLCLHRDGVLMLEFPYCVDFIEHREFDTIYFEHLSYLLIKPLTRLASQTGLDVIDVRKKDIHGGTVRVFIGHAGQRPVKSSVARCVAAEQAGGFHDPARYLQWSREIDQLVQEISTELRVLKNEGARIAAFAASAKGNTLLNACRLDLNTIEYIVDDTPEKIGRYSPGNGLPIVDRSILETDPPDHLLILAWNFADDIMESTLTYSEQGGKYVLPIPSFKIIDTPMPSTVTGSDGANR